MPANVEVGVKYRFHNGCGLLGCHFPRVFCHARSRFGPGRSVATCLGAGFGPGLFGGGGYAINPGSGNRDFWQSGLALTRTISPRLSIGGEITHQSPDTIGGVSVTAANLGAIYRLGGPYSILVSGGPAFERHREGARFQAYAALGLSF